MENKNIGALWLKESKSGTKFFSGILELEKGKKISIAIFKNKNKKSDKSPDYQILKSEQKEQNQKSEDNFENDIPF